jgi:hypothetical protein
MKPKIKRTSINLPFDLWQRVKHRAVDENVSAITILVRALEAYLATKKGGTK